MNKILKHYKYLIVLVFVLGIAAILRLFKLGEVPSGITNDEVTYVYNAYSILKTGRDLTGHFLPWISRVVVPYLPVPIYLNVPFLGVFGLNMFSARLDNALMGIIEILLLYLITKELFKSKAIALMSALSLAISPWHLQLTRSAYDPVPALLFYLLAVFVFISSVGKTTCRRLVLYLVSFLAFFLALFSYRATNLIFIPIVFSLTWWARKDFMKFKKYLLVFSLGVFLVLLSYVFINKSQGNYYTTEAFISLESPLNMNQAQTIVDSMIAKTNAPLFLSRIFINKLTNSMRVFRENYLEAFSIQHLFTRGEAQPVYSLWLRGSLYLIDLVFIIFGLIYLYKKQKNAYVFVILSLLIGPLPSALSGPTYTARSFYMLPFLCILIGGGLVSFWEYSKKYAKFIRVTLISIVFVLYFIQISSYLFQYYARYSIYGAEAWFRSTLDLSKYISQHPKNQIIVAKAWTFEFINYAFYTKLDPKVAQAIYKNEQISKQFIINNVSFISDCLNKDNDDPKTFLPPNTIYITRRDCQKKINPAETINRYDWKFTDTSEPIWKIYKSKDLLPQT